MAIQAASLHIGLNSVDPAHYGGWSGNLRACEADALAMRAIATSQGFSPTLLLTRQAQADTVKEVIATAARNLVAGDIFFLTYAGHGAQVPDTNGGDEDDGLDETWVLYDRMLVDDELYSLWAQFRPGVRIVALSDSCHSGTVLRVMPAPELIQPIYVNFNAAGGADNATKVSAAGESLLFRAMPVGVQDRTYLQHKELYDNIQRNSPADDRAAIGAGVILISGCQDNQLSRDGIENGLFTSKLLDVWNRGAFTGGYKHFWQEIKRLMPPIQTPNYFTVGAVPPDFENAKPFSFQTTVAAPPVISHPAPVAEKGPVTGGVVAGSGPGLKIRRRVSINIRVT